MVLRVARAFASVDVVLRSVHAGTSYWASELPLPTGVPLRVLHHHVQVRRGDRRDRYDSRVRFTAKTMSFVTGEKYEVDKTEACRSQADETTFTPMSRHVEVACRVHRCVGEVTVACRYANAGTGHWSSALPMPDGIAFNMYHTRLGVPVAHGATRSDRHDACVLSSSSGEVLRASAACIRACSWGRRTRLSPRR